MGISGFFGRRNLSKIDLDVGCPQEIYANKDFPLKISLKNKRGFLPAFLMKVNVDGHDTLFPFIDKKGESVKYINISCDKRGRHKIKDIYISSVFPFNFFIRYKKLDRSFDITVFPEPQKCELLHTLEKEKISKGEKYLDKTGYEAEIVSIREYIHGDSLKYINWKATAKTGDLKTKELSSLAYQPVVIDFEKSAVKNIEERISCITYIVLQMFKKSIPVGLRIGGRFYRPDISGYHKIAILEELAMYGTGETG